MAETVMATTPPTSQNKAAWYFNRLRCMSLAEITFRMRRVLKVKMEKAGIRKVRNVSSPDWTLRGSRFVYRLPDTSRERVVMAADRIALGHCPIFSLHGRNLFNPLRWNRDPLTGVEGPLEFGKSLDYRDERVVGNIKYLWEPNRHLHMVPLAQAWSLTGDEKYLNTIRLHLSSWFEQCPYPLGVNWSSSLELGIRLINWSLVWQWIRGMDSPLFSGKKGEEFRNRWMESIYLHVRFIHGFYSRHSSANNHLIGESAGVFVATVTWPAWPEFGRWRNEAKEILEQEALRQNGDDGVNREQAISYQQFVLDFLILSERAGCANDSAFSSGFGRRIEGMMSYLASTMDVGGNVPMIGDADDGYAVRLSQEDTFCPYRSLLATGAVLFGRTDFKRKAGSLDDKTRSLTGHGGADAAWDALQCESAGSQVQREFTDAGYYILGCDFDTSDEVRIVADCGPLGYLSLSAHGHADALAFTLSLAGKEFLIDPGTYAYHTEPKWRQYFRGTSAHNTARIDGVDQSVPGGNFMWLDKAEAECLCWQPGNDADRWTGAHHGYERLDDPVLHKRTLELDKSKLHLSVTDIFECKGSHSVERFWHFSELCEVRFVEGCVSVTQDGKSIDLRFSESDVELSVLQGDEVLPAGWVSRSFGVKVPTTTVIVRSRIRGATALRANIELDLGK